VRLADVEIQTAQHAPLRGGGAPEPNQLAQQRHRAAVVAESEGQIEGRLQIARLVQIQVEALDRNRLLSDVTRVLSDHHVNILLLSLIHI
jgi:(p)ppGpp synthase/HD superfamily hydrolase